MTEETSTATEDMIACGIHDVSNTSTSSTAMPNDTTGTTTVSLPVQDGDIILHHPIIQIPTQKSTVLSNRNNVTTVTPSSGTVTPVGGVTVVSGRIKAAPICRIPSLRKEHMTCEEMSKWCFSHEDVWDFKSLCNDSHNNYDNNNNNNVNNDKDLNQVVEKHYEEKGPNDDNDDMLDDDDEIIDKLTMMKDNIRIKSLFAYGPQSRGEWESFKSEILERNESRSGRETQRFATDAQTGQLFRLTTGCVPIMSDGKILLISSNRKGEWILPKGGWEMDETMEGSALRETYEEGGILGVIGPQLSEVEFETRKAKKRRLELESLKKKYEIACGNSMQHQDGQTIATGSSTVSVQSNTSLSIQSQSEDDQPSNRSDSGETSSNHSNIGITSSERRSTVSSPSNKECLATKIRNELHKSGNNTERHDDSASVASSNGSSNCTHVRLTMFPLYVLEVREHWPESGRARKVVDIDIAIETMSSRPEFHQVLLEVKQKGYHLNPSQHCKDRKRNMDKEIQVVSMYERDQNDVIRKETII